MAADTTKKNPESRLPEFWAARRPFKGYLTLKGLFILGIILSSYSNLQAQQLTGRVKSKTTMLPLDGITIRNKRTNDLYYSDTAGYFVIYASRGDTIRFTQLGYFDYEYIFAAGKTTDAGIIRLSPNLEILDTISITKPPTEYESDSLERLKTFSRQLKQQKEPFKIYENKLVARSTFGLTFDGIISSLFQKRARKYKRLWKFQERFNKQEQVLYINSRYNKTIVQNLTDLDDKEADNFMDQYPMDMSFITAATELELKMQILYNYRQWQKNKSDTRNKKE